MRIFIVALLCAFIACGCNEGKPAQTDHDGGHHHHSHNPQYGGLLIEVGDHFAHAEMVLAEDGIRTLYILDGEAENNVRIEQESIKVSVNAGDKTVELSLKGVASELTGEKVGDTSQFSATDEKLKGLKDFSAVVASCTIKGQKFDNIIFEFSSKEKHEHDGHDHDDHDHDDDHKHDDHDHDDDHKHDDHDH